MQHHVTVKISRAIFADNIRCLRARAAPAKLCVVMKADAYGHGLDMLAPVAGAAGAHYIGICTNAEARSVRRQLPSIPLLRLRSALPEEYLESVADLAIEEQVGSLRTGLLLDELGQRFGRPVPVHVNVDTGMGRSGFFPHDTDDIRAICKLPGLRVVGIMSHLASADGEDLGCTAHQLEEFWTVRRELADSLPPDVLTHTHNSAAAVRLPALRADLVRVGAACYGVRTSRAFENPPELKPVMSIKTRIMEVRSVPVGRTIGYGSLFSTQRASRIATIPVGFGEGYPRSLFNKGIVLIRGRRCPVVGRVSLNITTIDVTDLVDDLNAGEEVTLVGAQGGESITFEELAEKFSSVHTEINLMAGHMNERSYED